MKNSEQRRNDLTTREEVTAVLTARADAILKAGKLVEEAYRILHAVPYYGVDDALYSRCSNAVADAAVQIAGDKPYITSWTDTYVGNVAAGSLGRAIEAQLVK